MRMRSLSGSYAYYMSLGLTAARNRDFPRALSLMERAVEANPESPEAWINLARMHEALGDSERAVSILDRVLRDFPDNALAWFNRGAIREVGGDHTVTTFSDADPARTYSAEEWKALFRLPKKEPR